MREEREQEAETVTKPRTNHTCYRIGHAATVIATVGYKVYNMAAAVAADRCVVSTAVVQVDDCTGDGSRCRRCRNARRAAPRPAVWPGRPRRYR